jgi:glyoxylase-like metal-dependent hydrolase (beta-lactamase superfamily II)
VVASHAHIDHVGGFHEFATRMGHQAEAAGFADMNDAATLKHLFRDQAFGRTRLHQIARAYIDAKS